MRASDFDFNNRAQSIEYSENRRKQQFSSIEASAAAERVEQIVAKTTHSGFIDRKATITGSSFYD
jgi:hypothetical protein